MTDVPLDEEQLKRRVMREISSSWHALIKYLSTFTASTSRMLALAGGIICSLAMFVVIAQVLARYLFNYSIQGALAGVIIIAPLLFALGASYAQVTDSHIRVTLLADRLEPRPKQIVSVIVLLISTVMLSLLTWAAVRDAIEAWSIGQYETGLVRIPVYPTKAIICLSLVLLLFRNFVDLLRQASLRVQKGGS